VLTSLLISFESGLSPWWWRDKDGNRVKNLVFDHRVPGRGITFIYGLFLYNRGRCSREVYGAWYLARKEVFDLLDEDVAAHVGDGLCERELLGAGLNAVLRETALLDAAVAGEGAEAFCFEDFSDGVAVEELGLGDGGGTDEAGDVVELRADLHADGAGDAIGEWVKLFLQLRQLPRAFAEGIGAVDGDPGLDLLEVLEEDAAVDGEVADDGELRERREGDGLVIIRPAEFVDQGGAGHGGLAIDEHGAGAADLFEAVGVVGDGRGLFARDVDGVERDFAEQRGDVHAGAVGDLELFGGGGGVRVGLTLDLDLDAALCHANAPVSPKILLRLRSLERVEALIPIDFIRRQVKRGQETLPILGACCSSSMVAMAMPY
jgi:hypothetical protein